MKGAYIARSYLGGVHSLSGFIPTEGVSRGFKCLERSSV